MVMLKGNKRYFIGVVILIFSLMIMVGCSQQPAEEDAHLAPVFGETQPSASSQSVSDMTPAAEVLTQQEAAELFVHNLGYKIVMNSGANYDLKFPDTFTEEKNGV